MAIITHDRFTDESFDACDARIERSADLANAVDDYPLLPTPATPIAQLGGQLDSRIVATGDGFGHRLLSSSLLEVNATSATTPNGESRWGRCNDLKN